MFLCTVLFLLYAFTVLLSSFGLFQFRDGTKALIASMNAHTKSGLIQIAESSDEKALKVFGNLFGFIAVPIAAFYLVVVALGFQLSAVVARNAILAVAACVYIAGSINGWSRMRGKIKPELIASLKSSGVEGAAVGVIAVAMLAILYIALGMFNSSNWLYLALGFIAGGIVCALMVSIGFWLAGSVSMVLAFGPAFLALIYLRFVIRVAQWSLRLGKNFFYNLCIAYFIVGTIYLALLSVPGLAAKWGVKPLC